jgi:hypothetical protein
MFARVQKVQTVAVHNNDVQQTLSQWVRNLPLINKASDAMVSYTPMLDENLVSVVEWDCVSVAANIEDIHEIDQASVPIICAATPMPASDAAKGGLTQEEELYRRTDLERHMEEYIQGYWAYPLCVSQSNEGQAILNETVSCYRADRNFGYRLQKKPAKMNVVLAAPRKQPKLNEDNYMFEEDREHLYLTLRAAVVAAKQSLCQVLVLSDFGCGSLGHLAREVASIMYKVIFEFKKDF